MHRTARSKYGMDTNMSADPIRPHEFHDLVHTLKQCLNDHDRIRRLKASVASFTFNVDQAKQLFDNHAFRWSSSEGPLQAAAMIFQHLTDKERFEEVVKLFRLEEDRDELRALIH